MTGDDVIKVLDEWIDNYRVDWYSSYKSQYESNEIICRLVELQRMLHEALDKENNLPLTWDDLVKMKGKPVWLDMPDPKWVIIQNVGVCQDGSNIFTDSNDFYDMKDYGVKWTPYRKERV